MLKFLKEMPTQKLLASAVVSVLPLMNPVPLPIPFYGIFAAATSFICIFLFLFQKKYQRNLFLPNFFSTLILILSTVISCVFLAIPFPPFFLGTNFIPGAAIIFICLGLNYKRRKFLIAGYFMSFICIIYSIILVIFGDFLWNKITPYFISPQKQQEFLKSSVQFISTHEEKIGQVFDGIFEIEDENRAFSKIDENFSSSKPSKYFEWSEKKSRNFHQLMHISQIIYLQSEKIRNAEFKNIGFYTIQNFTSPVNGIFTTVLVNEKFILIVSRGTQEIRDLFLDFKSEGAPLNKNDFPGMVHKGFQVQVNSQWPELLKFLTSQFKSQQIILTGHSLGGAVSVLYGAYLLKNGFPPNQIYTFAQPRVGNTEFANWMSLELKKHNTEYIRYTYKGDIVPYLAPKQESFEQISQQLPLFLKSLPQTLLGKQMQYEHFGNWFHFESENKFGSKVSENDIEFWSALNSSQSFFHQFSFAKNILFALADHLPDKYSASTRKLSQKEQN
jgi:Lipase (class 3)